jgi:holo-ACP synthase
MYTAEDILLERERRIEYQEKIMGQFKMPLLVIRANYPGINKDNKFSQGITEVIERVICGKFSSTIHNKIITTTAEGPLVIMSINKEARDIKLVAIDVEEKHILGRCVDIDVYDMRGISMSRKDFGLGMRKCYICDDIAHICVRNKKHSMEEVQKFIRDRFIVYTEKLYEE